MKRVRLLVVLFCFSVLGTWKATSQVVVHIENAENRMIYLETFTLNGYQKIDSVRVSGGTVTFQVTAKTPPGMYTIGDGKEGFAIILNEKSSEFATGWPGMRENLSVISSTENQLYQSYREIRDKSYMQLDLLNQVLVNFDHAGSYYRTTLIEFMALQDRFEKWTDSLNRIYPGSFIVSFIRADKKPFIVPGLKLEAQRQFFQEHWFDEVDWQDNRMMTSDVLTSKITAYLGLYSNPNFGKAELSQAFMLAVDRLLPLARQNAALFDFTLKYLIRGFERYGFDDVILHIATNYTSNEQCENEQQSETIVRLEKYKLMAVGKPAPDLTMKDLNGNVLRLGSLKNKKLLVFWASWCPHCQQLLPQLVNWSRQPGNREISIIPISLDEDPKILQKTIDDLKIPWPVYSDFKKWNSPAAIVLNIYATPTMILLDGNNIILGKPMNIFELQQVAGK